MDLMRRGQWHPTPVLLPGKSHGWRSLMGCSPWGRYKLDTTEQLHFHFSLSYIGGGNGNPLQNSCLENPRDRGAWWAAVYGVAQSWPRLKRLSSSSMDLTLQVPMQYCSLQHWSLLPSPVTSTTGWMDNGGKFLQNMVHWRREWQITSLCLL